MTPERNSYQYTFTVVDLVLNDLRRPAGEGLAPRLKFLVLPLHLDGLESLRLPRTGKGQASFLRPICAGLPDDAWVEHDHILALVIKSDDAFVYADHVRCHADTAGFVGNQRVQKIPRCAEIFRRSAIGFLREKNLIFANLTYYKYILPGPFSVLYQPGGGCTSFMLPCGKPEQFLVFRRRICYR